jgi:hypothetical protein
LANQSQTYGSNSNTSIGWNDFETETNASRNLNEEEMRQQKQLLIKGFPINI